MIRFADENTKPAIWDMWQDVFGDKDEYVNLIFARKYQHENALIYIEDNKPVASLQMFPYNIRFYGEVVPFYYLAGLCTLPEYRNRGIMGQLILESFAVMQERQIPLSILVPAEDWLYAYYEKYGFIQTFDKGTEPIDMKNLLHIYANNPKEAFTFFDLKFQQGDFCVLKTENDLEIIIDDYLLDDCPAKYNLGAMSRVIDPLSLLNKYAFKNPDSDFKILIHDKQIPHNSSYCIKNGMATIYEKDDYDFELDEKLLTQLLFGYKMENIPSEFQSYFTSHQPAINLMLE